MILLLGVSLICAQASSHIIAAQCTPSSRSLQQFHMNPNPTEYDSGRRRNVGETGLPSDRCTGNPLVCLASDVPIGDGNHEPISLTDLSSTFAWNEDVTITMGLTPESRARAINLFFYNIPSMGIGLPHEIELNWGTNPLQANNRLGHAVLGNSDLSQEDNTTRNITIVAIADDSGDETSYRSISITFHFSDVNPIRWVILSEVEICMDRISLIPRQDSVPLTTQGDEEIWLQPNNIQSEIDLTCTVVIDGSFQWVWSGPFVDMSQQVFADNNRTSSITLTQLSADSAGIYYCKATYDPRSLPMGVTTSAMGSRIFTLQFESAVIKAISGTHVFTSPNSLVTLSCEIYGYFPRGSQPQITWQKINGETISSSSSPYYTITISNGSRQIQNGGSSPGPSHVSSLTINVINESVADTYVCSGPSSFQAFQLDVEGTNMLESGGSQGIGSQLIGGVIGAVAFIIVIVVIMLVLVRCGLTRYRSRKSMNYDTVYDLPVDYDRPLPPPVNTIPLRLDMHTNNAYEIPSMNNTVPCNIESAINYEDNTIKENVAKTNMQENEVYQPTPAHATDAANTLEISMNENVAYESNGPSSSTILSTVNPSRFQEEDSDLQERNEADYKTNDVIVEYGAGLRMEENQSYQPSTINTSYGTNVGIAPDILTEFEDGHSDSAMVELQEITVVEESETHAIVVCAPETVEESAVCECIHHPA